jgi:hypothetical protein
MSCQRPTSTLWLVLSTSLLLASLPASATEGGVGRPITGQQINPLAGVVPPEPGAYVTLSSIYYDGSLGSNSKLALGNSVTSDTDLKVSYNYASVSYVWDTGPGRWNFASGLLLPFQYTDINAGLRGSFGVLNKNVSDSATQMADMAFVPLAAGYHFSKTEHVALSLQIFAPTGSYDKNRLANAGQNTWTFIPTVAYTHILPQDNVELTASWGVEFYTPNSDTHYHNGVVNTVDATAIKRFDSSWGAGLMFGWIQQLTDDTGGLANTLGGDRGRALGLGPILTWQGKLGTQPLSASLRWVNEFDVANRPRGNGFQLNASSKF